MDTPLCIAAKRQKDQMREPIDVKFHFGRVLAHLQRGVLNTGAVEFLLFLSSRESKL